MVVCVRARRSGLENVRKPPTVSDMTTMTATLAPGSGKTASVMQHVRRWVMAKPEGEPFAVREVLEFGPRATIDQSLSRLVKEKVLERPARGVYARPKVNKIVNRPVPVPVEQVVQTAARAKGEKIGVHGAEAARRFGLTTQVPMRRVFTTTGPTRQISVEGQRVRLQHVQPRYMALSGTHAGEALAALLYLGKSEVTAGIAARVCKQLTGEELRTLRKHVADMPAWLSTTMHGVPQFAMVV